jgi:hypothetical protein
MDEGRLVAPNERWEGVSTLGKSRGRVGTHLRPWGLPRPPPHSTADRDGGNVIYDVPIIYSVVFTVPTGRAIELRESVDAVGCGGDISTTTMPVTTPPPRVTLHIAFVVFVAVRPVRRR